MTGKGLRRSETRERTAFQPSGFRRVTWREFRPRVKAAAIMSGLVAVIFAVCALAKGEYYAASLSISVFLGMFVGLVSMLSILGQRWTVGPMLPAPGEPRSSGRGEGVVAEEGGETPTGPRGTEGDVGTQRASDGESLEYEWPVDLRRRVGALLSLVPAILAGGGVLYPAIKTRSLTAGTGATILLMMAIVWSACFAGFRLWWRGSDGTQGK